MQYIFEGTLLNETRLLTCETIASRDEVCVCVSCGFYVHILWQRCLALLHSCISFVKEPHKKRWFVWKEELGIARAGCGYRVATPHRMLQCVAGRARAHTHTHIHSHTHSHTHTHTRTRTRSGAIGTHMAFSFELVSGPHTSNPTATTYWRNVLYVHVLLIPHTRYLPVVNAS